MRRSFSFAGPLAAAGTGLAAGPLLVGLAAYAPPLVAGGLVAALAGAAVVAVWPQVGLLLTAAVVPLERIGRLTNDSSMVGFSLMRVVGFGTLACFLLHHLVARRRLLFTRPLLLYAGYAAVGIVSLSYTTDWEYSVRSIAAVIGNLLFFFLVINMVDRSSYARAAIVCWLAVTAAIGVFTIYQWHRPAAVVSEDPFHSTGERDSSERFATVLSDTSEYELIEKAPRALGSTSHPAVYAINLILALPFWAYLWRTSAHRGIRLLAAAGAAVTCYNVVLANTRAAVLTLVIVAAVIALTGLVRVTARGVAAAAIVAVLALPFAPAALYDRIFDFSKYTTSRSETLRARLMYWTEGVEIFLDHWLTGVGIGNQSELPRRLSARVPMPPNSTVHNEYLQSLLETGLLGYPLLGAFIVSLHRTCRAGERRFRKAADVDAAWMMTASRVALIAVLVYGAQVDVLHFPLKGWWLAMGLAVALVARLPVEDATRRIASAQR